MTLPGGAADKLGNRYEKWWTLSEFVRMLRGDTEAIRIEAPGVDKAEFVVAAGAHRELHQVKRSHPNGKWSLAALRTDGLLEALGSHLADNADRFVFASGSDARALADLCESARHAESPEEFERHFLAAGGRQGDFRALLDCWACDVPLAIERLRRVEVRTIDERELEDKVRWGVQALFLAGPRDVVEALRGIAEDAVHRTITRQQLVDDLSRRSYCLRRLPSPASAGDAVRNTTERYLGGARRRLIRQQLVAREASKTLLQRLGAPGGAATDSVLTGKAGAGKTACVVEVVDTLREQGVPVLAFRLDRLDRFASASTTPDLGRVLDLEESPTLVLAAAAEAAGLPGVLIVDQLDAVSTVSGRNAGVFDLIEQLLREARGSRPRAVLHTVVVCRKFDWENDASLRRLMPSDAEAQAARVDVAEFSIDEVKEILTAAGFDPTPFAERQLKVLQLPQNLSLFLDAEFDASRPPPFRTATEIFDRYWDAKQRSMAERVAPASDDHWMAVIETLCDEMTRTQQLSVRREALDAFPRDYVHQLASEGVLTRDGRRYAFGHESFLDYAFARVFVRRTEPLVSFLKASEQHLFRRAQVRQVLAYLRDDDPPRYAAELRRLLADEDIRPHLKDLAFALLAEVPDPTEEEWTIWRSWTTPALSTIADGTPNPNQISAIAWRRFFGSPSWFAAADRRGVIEDWLTSQNDRIIDNVAVNYLRLHQRNAPDRVAALLEPYADHGGAWMPRLRHITESAELHTSRRFFDLFLRLVDNGTLDDARPRLAENSTFWSMLYRLSEHRPEWTPEVVAHRLRRRLAILREAGTHLASGTLFQHDRFVAERLVKAADNAPAAFVKHVLPVVLDVSDAAATGDTPPRRDAVWPILFKSAHPNGENACLSGLADALAALASAGVVPLDDVIADLRRRETYISNYLLLALYRGGAARYADEAVALLCDQPWRFECGFSDSSNWCAMETIRAVVPHCTVESRKSLEEAILNYVSAWERTRAGYKRFGRARFNLLSVIPAELRSKDATKSFDELKRKFGEPTEAPRGITVTSVTSPIGENDAEKMTDDQWLRAIAKYTSEDRINHSGNAPTGGAWELVRVLEAQVKEDPTRFVQLALRFPTDANPVYLQRTLAALKDHAIADDLKLQLCRKAFADAPDACGGSITDALGQMEDPLPDDAVQMLTWLATRYDDPTVELWRKGAGGGQPHGGGDVHAHGINTTRMGAADAIRDLILTNAAYIERFRPALDRMVRDPSAAVRSCVAGALRAVTFHDAALGMSLFQTMDMSEDGLLVTPHVYDFIRTGLHDRFVELRSLVERMLRSSEPEVREAGSRLACISALLHESAADLADEALHSGHALSRLGVAQVAAANVAAPEHRVWCESRLATLFDDPDADVRGEAASCFDHFPDEVLDTCGALVESFCNSRAFEEAPFCLLNALEHARDRLPGITCMVCERYLGRADDEASDPRTGRFADAHTVVKLIFRTYQQHQNDEWASRALGLIDRLCLEGIASIGNEFDEFER